MSAATQDASVPDSSVAIADAGDVDALARGVVARWNDAHSKHDAHALELLYAQKVTFYGTPMTASECAKRKAAAFAKSPSFAQSVRDVRIERPNKTEILVQFVKTTTVDGKSTDYPAFLRLDKSLVITEESDKITDANLQEAQRAATRWCLDEDGIPTTRVKPPFTISVVQALEEIHGSKHFAALQAAHDGQPLGIDIPFTCPTQCAPATRDCGFDFRIVNPSDIGVTTSIMVEWVYVDAVKNVLWWGYGDQWFSENLVSKPAVAQP